VKRCSLRKYGISEADFFAMLERQRYACAICSRSIHTGGEKVAWPHVDHCHRTGVVRGLLCHHCNVLIGHASDDAGVLRSAIRYLGENP
jgi:hypothetical protein